MNADNIKSLVHVWYMGIEKVTNNQSTLIKLSHVEPILYFIRYFS